MLRKDSSLDGHVLRVDESGLVRDAVATLVRNVVEQVLHELTFDVADEEWQERHIAGTAAFASAQDFVVIGANDSVAFFFVVLLVGGDGGLAALGALVKVLGIFSFPVVQVVHALNQLLVAFLEPHDQSRSVFALAQLEHA